MIPAPIPTDEAERLSALRALMLLDTPREERFDRLVRFAAEQLDTPIRHGQPCRRTAAVVQGACGSG